MGLAGALVDFIEKTCPEAWSHLRADGKKWLEEFEARLKRETCGIPEDCLGRVNKLHSPRHDDTFTGLELLEGFFRPVAYDILERGCRLYPLCFDYQPGVPKEKWEEQKARSTSSKAEAYPHNAEIVDGGVLLPGQSAAEQINLRRLAKSRHLKMKVWDYLMKNIGNCSHFRFRVMPKNLLILMNYVGTGPYVIRVNPETGRLAKPIEAREYAHELGEADPAVWYFACYHLKRKNAIVKTIDSDAMPFGWFHMEKRLRDEEDKGVIAWQTERKKHKTIVDMRLARKLTLERLKLSMVSFAMLCIFMGTDYVNKNSITRYIGVKAVHAMVQHHNTEITKIWGKKFATEADDDERSIRLAHLKKLLFALYWDHDHQAHDALKLQKNPTDWEELYESLRPIVEYSKEMDAKRKALAAQVKKRKAETESKEQQSEEPARKKAKSRKGPKATTEEPLPDKIPKTEPETNLRPPDSSMLEKLVDNITFNIRYWRSETNNITRKLFC